MRQMWYSLNGKIPATLCSIVIFGVLILSWVISPNILLWGLYILAIIPSIALSIGIVFIAGFVIASIVGIIHSYLMVVVGEFILIRTAFKVLIRRD